MKKKLFSAICAFVIALSQCGMVFAAEEIEEINIVDKAVSDEFVEAEVGAVTSDSSALADTDPAIEDIKEDTLLFSDGNEPEDIGIEEDNEASEDAESISLMSNVFLSSVSELDMSYRYKTSKNDADTAVYSELKSFGFSKDTISYNVFLPDNVQYAYLKVALPGGTETEIYTINGENTDLVGVQEMSLTSNYQYKMKNPVQTETIDGEDYYIIPIKNEFGTASVTYKKDGAETEYKVKFYASQPKLTSFTQYADTNICFTGGAAANNDNGTVIDSAADGTVIRALSNISKKLVGASVFMLPISKMKASGSWFIKNKNADMFEFKADHAGTVYIMTYAANTQNFNTENGWTTVNNGVTGTGITISSSSSVARTKNDYTNTEYFAGMYGWKCLKENAEFTGANKNRVNRLTGTLSTSYIDSNSTKTLKYVYSKEFSADETVKIPVPNEISTSWQGMAVLVNWDADINENVISLTEEDIPGNAVFRVLYSDKDGEYTKIPTNGYDSDNSYTVNFENNTEFGYIKLRLPDGTSAAVTSESSGGYDISETSGYYLIPITDGSEKAVITYKDESGAEKVYSVIFTSSQYDAKVKMKYAQDAEISFVRGAALGKNGFFLENETDEFEKTEKVITSSAELYGASVFMLPFEDIKSSGNWTASHPDEDMFSFVPESGGKVYVLTDSAVLFNSEYELLWDVESSLKCSFVTRRTDLQTGKVKSESTNLNYAYSYDFEKNEEVFIPVPELETWKGNLVVAIKWN